MLFSFHRAQRCLAPQHEASGRREHNQQRLRPPVVRPASACRSNVPQYTTPIATPPQYALRLLLITIVRSLNKHRRAMARPMLRSPCSALRSAQMGAVVEHSLQQSSLQLPIPLPTRRTIRTRRAQALVSSSFALLLPCCSSSIGC